MRNYYTDKRKAEQATQSPKVEKKSPTIGYRTATPRSTSDSTPWVIFFMTLFDDIFK